MYSNVNDAIEANQFKNKRLKINLKRFLKEIIFLIILKMWCNNMCVCVWERERYIYIGKWNFEPNFHVKNTLFHDHMFSQPRKLKN
jgi:hypothetical protein